MKAFAAFGLAAVLQAQDGWKTETPLPGPLQEVSVTALNNLVYMVGGSNGQARVTTVFTFDPVTHSWQNPTSYPGLGRDHIGIAAANGFLFLIGGLTAWPGPSVTTVQKYTPATNTWADVAPLPQATGAAGVAVLNGKIYVAGGLRNGVAVTDFLVYDPAANTWTSLPAMPTARDHVVAVALKGKIYAIGGRPGANAICTPIKTVEVFDPVTNAWTAAAPMAVARGGHGAGTLNGRIQVFGGEGAATGCGVISSSEQYDPATNAWTALPNMGTARHGTGGATIGQSIYVPGGATASGDAPTALHERFDQAAPVVAPATTVLSDDFNDGIRDTTKWTIGVMSDGLFPADPAVTVVEQTGQLRITPRASQPNWHYNGYVSASTFDLTGGASSVDVIQAPNTTSSADLTFVIGNDANNFYRFVIESGWLRFDDAVAGTRNQSLKIAYNPTLHKRLRLLHDKATDSIHWDTFDGSAWTTQRSALRKIPLTASRVEMGAGTWTATTPGVVIFDNYALEPAAAGGTTSNAAPKSVPGGPYKTTNLTVSFNGGGSTDSDGTIASYQWNFGDGQTGIGVSASHTYATPGIYDVTLTVTDDKGGTGVGSTSVAATQSTTLTDPAVVGQWAPVSTWPIVAVNASLLPDGNVLAWQHEETSIPYVWNPTTNVFTQTKLTGPNERRDSLYCSIQTLLADGRLFSAGGHIEPRPDDVFGSNMTNIFDPGKLKWFKGPNMAAGRWYPGATMLGDGTVLLLSGSIDDQGPFHGEGYAYKVNETVERYDPVTDTISTLTTANMPLPLYPYTYILPDGRVLSAGPETTTRILNPAGTGSWTTLGFSSGPFRQYGTSVEYDPGKVMIVGGGDPPTAKAEVLDMNVAAPAWRTVAPLKHPRKEVSGVLLPDGKIFIVGGTMSPGFANGFGGVLQPEVWDPATETWTTVASMNVIRTHHSTALLLADGRVLVAGGGQPLGPNDFDHFDAQLYSPPYLFKGARPTIQSVPSSLTYGQSFNIGTPDVAGITDVILMRLGTITHQFGLNQKRVKLPFTKGTGTLSTTTPANPNVCPPGFYMVMVINSQGVPSVAKMVNLNVTAPAPPSGLTATASSTTQINLNWTDASTNETAFRIERSPDNVTFTQIATVKANIVTYADTGLTAATQYYYRVRATNVSADSAYSNVATATTTGTVSVPVPAAPSGLTATAANATQINLSWTDASTNETGFKIERSPDNVTFTQIATVGAGVVTFANTGLTASTQYFYRVRATNASGDSAYSNVANATTTASSIFVKLDTTTAGTWKSAYGGEGYNVIGNATSYPAYVNVTQTGNLSFTWAATTADVRGLQKAPPATDRIASCWYSGSSFQVNLAFTDTVAHQVAIYMLDWDTYQGGRTQRVDVLDAANNVIDTRSVSGFTGGQYLVWNLSGQVSIRITNTNAPGNAVISGIFFGGASAPPPGPGLAMTGLTVMNSTTNQPNTTFPTITNGATVTINRATSGPISLRAETSGTVGSVVFKVDGAVVRTEGTAPYAIAGDTGTPPDYSDWTVSAGTHTVTATPFSAANGAGTAGTALTATLIIQN